MKVAVIGCGSIGRRHLRDLVAIQAEEPSAYSLELMACDTNPNAARAAAAEFGAEVAMTRGAPWNWGAEAVLICTPPYHHVDLALEAIETGTNVFIEKPLSLSMDGVAELVALAAERDLVAQVAAPLRYIDELEQMQENVQAGAYDDPVRIGVYAGYYLPDVRPDYQTAYTARTGVMLDVGSHALDLATWIAGDMKIDGAWTSSSLGLDCGTVAHVELQGREHTSGCITVSWEAPERSWRVVVNGHNRRDVWDMPANIDRAYYLEMAGFLESCACHYTLAGNTLPQAERTLRTLLEAKAWPAQ